MINWFQIECFFPLADAEAEADAKLILVIAELGITAQNQFPIKINQRTTRIRYQFSEFFITEWYTIRGISFGVVDVEWRQSDRYQRNVMQRSESDKLSMMVWNDAITAIVSRVDPRSLTIIYNKAH